MHRTWNALKTTWSKEKVVDRARTDIQRSSEIRRDSLSERKAKDDPWFQARDQAQGYNCSPA